MRYNVHYIKQTDGGYHVAVFILYNGTSYKWRWFHIYSAKLIEKKDLFPPRKIKKLCSYKSQHKIQNKIYKIYKFGKQKRTHLPSGSRKKEFFTTYGIDGAIDLISTNKTIFRKVFKI